MILNIPASDYHADNVADTPTLSAGIANLLITASPAHAKANHPKLNPDYQPTHDDKFSIGTVAHALLLQGMTVAEVVQADSWRSKAAQEAKADAVARGRVPLLPHQYGAVMGMYDAVAHQLAKLEVAPTPFTAGEPEQTLVWDEDGVKCRARIDWLHSDLRFVDDLKTTSRYANPEAWQRGALYDHGCDVQAAFYLRGLRAYLNYLGDMSHPFEMQWRWVVVETQPPYALSVIAPGASVLALGDAKVEKALALWRRCLETNEWPAYPRTVVEAELPPWVESRWLEREAREEITA